MWTQLDAKSGTGISVGATGRVIASQGEGTLTAVGPLGRTREFRGWNRPRALALSATGDELFVAEEGGRLSAVSARRPARARSRMLANGLLVRDLCCNPADGDVYLLPGGGRLLPEAGAGRAAGPFIRGDVQRLDPEGGVPVALGLSLPDPVAIAAGSDGTLVVVGRGGTVTTVPLGGAATSQPLLATGAWSAVALDGDVAFVASDTEPAVVSVNLSTGHSRPTKAPAPIRGVAVFDGTVYIVTDSGSFACPAIDLDPDRPRLSGIDGPTYHGGYARVSFEPGGSGLGLDDVELVVAEGPQFGGVSVSPDDDPANDSFLLLAGPTAGDFTAQIRRRDDGTVIAEDAFEIVDYWTGADGPSQAYAGRSNLYGSGNSWGSLWAAVFPWSFSFGAQPITGVRNVAIIMVNTSDVALAAGTETAYRNAFIDGVVLPDGRRVSTAGYWNEISGGRISLALAGIATVNLSRTWAEYHQPFSATDRRFAPRQELLDDAIAQAQAAVNLFNVDSVIFVVPSPNGGQAVPGGNTDRQFVWPQAAGGRFLIEGPGPFFNSFWWWKSLAWVAMPAEWEVVDGRRIFATLTHEIGHTLGLGDLYGESRSVDDWDVMAVETQLPALSLPHRVAAGWTSLPWVRRYNFLLEPVVDEEVWLTSANLVGAGPAAGQKAGLIVEVADGWRYYFEYRSEQDGPGVEQLADRNLAEDRRIVGYDVVAGSFTPPVNRTRPILLLNDDGDGEGPVLAVAEDYEELDATANSTFKLELLEANDSAARVRVRYQPVPAPVPPWPNGPDPSIRPWPGGDNWQSPDIRVENPLSDLLAKNLPGFGQGVPWAGHDNRVVATVRNTGNMDAAKVQVGFWVKDFTVSAAGPEMFLGWDVRDVAIGAATDFSVNWTPPKKPTTDPVKMVNAHYCIVARITPYVDPADPRIGEVSQSNNVAQSNFTVLFASASSPLTRPRVPVSITNPFSDRRVRARVEVTQSEEAWRTYVEHSFVWLAPGETRTVEVMFECLLDHPDFPDLPREEIMRTPNVVAVLGMVDDPGSDIPTVIGGATVHVVPGRATRFRELDLGLGGGVGRVLFNDTGAPVEDGEVLVSARSTDGTEIVATAPVDASGRFRVTLPGGPNLARPVRMDLTYVNRVGISPTTHSFEI